MLRRRSLTKCSPDAGALVALLASLLIGVLGCGESSPPARACGKAGDPDAGLAALPAPEAVWTHATGDAAYFAPRAVDLDGDGRTEVLVAGGSESPAFGELSVIDAITGAPRWSAVAEHELYSSPVVIDLTGDGVKDVIIGGREETLLALDGVKGWVIWQFEDTRVMPDYYFYNFYTPLLVPDQTGDGLPDLLVSNGGSDGIGPGEARPPGHLLLLNSADGTVVSYAEVPDGRETYMSPVLLPDDGAASPTILFGTGGETWGGSLWKTSLAAVVAGDISDATELATGARKGMIAPPALADIDGDERLDIVVATFDGHLLVLSGATDEVIWQQTFKDGESFSTPALGYFDADETPDVFGVFLHGTFPTYVSAERVILSGRDGSVLWRGETGDFAMATDVAVDLDGDGIDEVIFNANTLRDPLSGRTADQELHLLDSACRSERKWGTAPGGFAAGAPWVGDLDGDGALDLLLPRHSAEPDNNDGLLTRFRVDAPVPKHIRWGGYFGSEFDSIMQPR